MGASEGAGPGGTGEDEGERGGGELRDVDERGGFSLKHESRKPLILLMSIRGDFKFKKTKVVEWQLAQTIGVQR
jgi:hypothetical protein